MRTVHGTVAIVACSGMHSVVIAGCTQWPSQLGHHFRLRRNRWSACSERRLHVRHANANATQDYRTVPVSFRELITLSLSEVLVHSAKVAFPLDTEAR